MRKLVLAFTALLAGANLHAQLFIDNNYTIDQMIHGFFDNSGVAISNVTYTGIPLSLGFFEGSQSNIGMNAGLLITSGEATNAIGPNDSESMGTAMNIGGSPWLDALIPGYVTFDAAVIEMDVVPNSDTLLFRYVFGSEEYLEFVNTNFNDLFAFLVEGPGLPQGDSIWVQPDTTIYQNWDSCYVCIDTMIVNSGVNCYYDSLNMLDTCIAWSDTAWQWCYFDQNCTPGGDTVTYPGYWYYSPGGVNIAMVPGTNLPVAINTLNQFVNTQYFIENPGGTSVQYDAFTTPLWASVPVQAGQTYHIRIAVADAGDPVFDSGVFLGIESMGADSLLPAVPDFLVQAPNGSTTVSFQNTSLWATKYHWDFGDGITSDEKNPTHDYALAGVYNVSLTVQNWCSTKTYTQEVLAGVSSTTATASDIFRVLPNPTNGVFRLDLKNDERAQTRLFSLDGRLLLDDELNDGARVDLNTFGKGIYLLQVVSNGQVYSSKIVNQ